MKKALIIIGVVIVLLLLVALFLPSTARVERSAVIKAPVAVVFDQVVDLEKYLVWSPWSAKDPEMKVEWMDVRSGQGAGYSWEGNEKVGKGIMTVEEVLPNEMIRNKLDFGMMGAGYGIWNFEPVASETEGTESNINASVKVTWTLESDLDRPIPLIGRYFAIFMDFESMVGPDFEEGLVNLKNIAESIPVMPDIEIETMDVVEVTMLSVRDSCAIADLSARLGELYGEIVGYMNEKDIEIRSQPLCVYHKWAEDEGYTVIEAGIPIAASRDVKPTGRIKKSTIPGGSVVKATHRGSYESSARAHYAIDEWMKKNGREMRGGPWEVYVTDPANEPDTNKWITEIFYPLL